jgi:putative transposase
VALTEHYYTKFYNGCFYHIYNRSVDKKPMFKNDGNYEFFLNKYFGYLSPVLDTYAYCLLGNHFHLLVRIHDNIPTDLTTFKKLSNLSTKSTTSSSLLKTTHNIVSHQFRKFFQSYAMAFNKQQSRTGTLFQTPFKRALVDSDQYFTRLVYYIHANPQLHGLIDDFTQWNWSSYQQILHNKPGNLKNTEVINWFGGTEGYKQFHLENQKLIHNEKYIMEDE